MKNKILYAFICITFTGFAVNSSAQANTALSNLTYPTAINVDLLPKSTNTYNLGSSNKQWHNLYLAGSVYLSGLGFISASTESANTFVGISAGSITTGDHNSFFGNA